MYEIDKGIEIPQPRSEYPFGEMEIGDSFLAPKEKIKGVRAAASEYGKRKSKRFMTRTVEGGVRVWRVE